jgi:RNA recognition motif-containing protein
MPQNTKPDSKMKTKGYAFLEFDDKKSLQQALNMHLSVLDGRKINVELTVGGGGKSEARMAKLRDRNKELHGQRVSSRLPLLGWQHLMVSSSKKESKSVTRRPRRARNLHAWSSPNDIQKRLVLSTW